MATWPASLPVARTSGYTLEYVSRIARTDMDAGAARTRRRFTSAPDEVKIAFVFSAAEMAAFRLFWDGAWAQGAAWIVMPIADGYSAGVENREVRPLDGKFSATPQGGGRWVVQITIEVRNA